MLAFIGFVVLAALGVCTLLCAKECYRLYSFCGWQVWLVPTSFFTGVGSFLVWLACHLAPFTITWAG